MAVPGILGFWLAGPQKEIPIINTGRTVRAAVDHLIDLGRPKVIHLAVLIDRGGREFPIAANYVDKKIKLSVGGDVKVRVKEVDRVDGVVISA